MIRDEPSNERQHAAFQDRQRSELAKKFHQQRIRRLNWALASIFGSITVLSLIFYEGQTVVGNLDRMIGSVLLEEPVYQGLDAQGNPFEISAKTAYPDAINPNNVDLQNVYGSFTTPQGNPLTFQAEKGFLSLADNKFQLEHNIVVEGENGFQASAEHLQTDVDHSKLTLTGSVSIASQLGYISAQTAVFNKKKKTALFEGSVRLLIN